jgi:hypothetical protein
MKILCRDDVIRGTTGQVSTGVALGSLDHQLTVHMALLSDIRPEQPGCQSVHNPQHYSYSL